MPKIKYDAIDLFIDQFREKYGCCPSQKDKRVITEEVVSFVHRIETTLINEYKLDYEYK